MNATTADAEIRAYVQVVEAELADLPATEREELLEDLEAHLREVAAEGEGDLAERLGPPDAYAEELRTAARLPTRDETMGPLGERLARAISRSGPARALSWAAASKAARMVRRWGADLRPAWWVARGYLIVATIDLFDTPGREGLRLIPAMAGSAVLGFVATVGAVVGSVAIGRRRAEGGYRVASFLANVLVVLLVIPAAAKTQRSFAPTLTYAQEQVVVAPSELHHPDGAPIADICPYAADGTPLEEVLLLDPDGRPIASVADEHHGRTVRDDPTLPGDRHEGLEAFTYPRARWVHDGDGMWERLVCPRPASEGSAETHPDASQDPPPSVSPVPAEQEPKAPVSAPDPVPDD